MSTPTYVIRFADNSLPVFFDASKLPDAARRWGFDAGEVEALVHRWHNQPDSVPLLDGERVSGWVMIDTADAVKAFYRAGRLRALAYLGTEAAKMMLSVVGEAGVSMKPADPIPEADADELRGRFGPPRHEWEQAYRDGFNDAMAGA